MDLGTVLARMHRWGHALRLKRLLQKLNKWLRWRW